MGKPGWVECSKFDVIPADRDNTGYVQIFSGVGCDKSGPGQEVGVKDVERFAFVFLNEEFEPIDEGIVSTFVCAETCDGDPVCVECLFPGGGQAQRRGKDADGISSRR